jgi:hypothetical protein
MVFLSAIASGTEQAIGESANSISYLAGVNLGKKLSEGVPHTNDIEQALAATREVLVSNDYLWLFETFKTHDQESMFVEDGDETQVMLVFRDKNAQGAAESLNAAQDMEQQVERLEKMVSRFKF